MGQLRRELMRLICEAVSEQFDGGDGEAADERYRKFVASVDKKATVLLGKDHKLLVSKRNERALDEFLDLDEAIAVLNDVPLLVKQGFASETGVAIRKALERVTDVKDAIDLGRKLAVAGDCLRPRLERGEKNVLQAVKDLARDAKRELYRELLKVWWEIEHFKAQRIRKFGTAYGELEWVMEDLRSAFGSLDDRVEKET